MSQLYTLEILKDDPANGSVPIDAIVAGPDIIAAKTIGKSLFATRAMRSGAQAVRLVDQQDNEVWRWDGAVEIPPS